MSTPLPKKKINQNFGEMNFFDALKFIVDGNKVTKLEWGNKDIYIFLDGGYLRIHKDDGKIYDLIIRDADLLGEDWLVI